MNRLLLLTTLLSVGLAQAAEDPLQARVQTRDAHRFAALFLALPAATGLGAAWPTA